MPVIAAEQIKTNAQKTNKQGLAQLDAEAVLSQTSPYRSTAEWLETAKKTHKMEKSVEFFDGFQLIWVKTL